MTIEFRPAAAGVPQPRLALWMDACSCPSVNEATPGAVPPAFQAHHACRHAHTGGPLRMQSRICPCPVGCRQRRLACPLVKDDSPSRLRCFSFASTSGLCAATGCIKRRRVDSNRVASEQQAGVGGELKRGVGGGEARSMQARGVARVPWLHVHEDANARSSGALALARARSRRPKVPHNRPSRAAARAGPRPLTCCRWCGCRGPWCRRIGAGGAPLKGR